VRASGFRETPTDSSKATNGNFDMAETINYPKIKDAMECNTSERLKFLPKSELQKLMRKPVVEATLQRLNRRLSRKYSITDLANYICNDAPKVFAILIMIGRPTLIEYFYENNFRQEMLPVASQTLDPDEGTWEVKSCSGRDYGEKVRKTFLCGEASPWNEPLVDAFCYPGQWRFIVPTFIDSKFRYEFEDHRRLPFTTYGGRKDDQSTNYSWVEERSIHASHIEWQSDQAR
jgi:hypothetical protein